MSRLSISPWGFTFSFTLTILAFAGLVWPAIASAENLECRMELATPGFTAQSCDLPESGTLVTVRFLDAGALLLHAQFPSTDDRTAQAHRVWNRLWLESVERSLTAPQQLSLRKAVFMANPATLTPPTRAVLDFLANFLEPGQTIEAVDRRVEPAPAHVASGAAFGLNSFFSFNLICDAIGTWREASFTAVGGGSLTRATLLVGDRATRCRGRCGMDCEQPFQWRGNQYTQECLNHDACRDASGEILGACNDEFWAAAYGYLLAPDCLQVPQSKAPAESRATGPAPASNETSTSAQPDFTTL